MKKVTRLKVRVLQGSVQITSYGQSARGTKFSMGQVNVYYPPGEGKPTLESLGDALEHLRPSTR